MCGVAALVRPAPSVVIELELSRCASRSCSVLSGCGDALLGLSGSAFETTDLEFVDR